MITGDVTAIDLADKINLDTRDTGRYIGSQFRAGIRFFENLREPSRLFSPQGSFFFEEEK